MYNQDALDLYGRVSHRRAGGAHALIATQAKWP
jgi:hypothetical protein